MEYTDQFIRLNCSLMSDYKMMKLRAEMKCVGVGLYVDLILFLRNQQEYRHNLSELDLLADEWGTTVGDLCHLIKDFDLFEIAEDGYFRCLYLDEVMGYQHKISEQRAASGRKGGQAGKKTAAKTSTKTAEKVAASAPEKEEESVKNTIEKSDVVNEAENTLQLIDNKIVNVVEQASFKQNFKREEKKREEKKKNDLEIKKEKIEVESDSEKEAVPMPRWEQCVDEAFGTRSREEIVGMMSELKSVFRIISLHRLYVEETHCGSWADKLPVGCTKRIRRFHCRKPGKPYVTCRKFSVRCMTMQV